MRARGAAPAAVVAYRRLRPTDDLVALTDLLHQAYAPLAAAGMRFVASHQDVETTRRRIAKGDTVVAVRSGGIVGTIAFADVHATNGSPFYDRPDVASFGQFAVHPACQRQGIGTRLMQRVERSARVMGAAELALDTSERAHGLIAMYQKQGYRFIEFAQWDDVNYRSCIFSKTLRGRTRVAGRRTGRVRSLAPDAWGDGARIRPTGALR